MLPYLFIFLASLYMPSDPDLGWHLKYGEYFFKHHQILRDNTFSTMMPGYKWANGEWITDNVTYFIFHYSGFAGLSLISAFIVTLTFYFFAKAARLKPADTVLLFPLIVFLEDPINSVSFRGQQISILLTGVLCLVLSIYKPNSKILYFLPLLFLFWANIHLQFILGLAILGIWISISIIRNYINRNENKKSTTKELIYLASIFILSIMATFINPFGAGIHIFALSHFNNPLLKNIAEYLPFSPMSKLWWTHMVITILFMFGIIFLLFRGKLINLAPIIGTAFIIFGLSVEVRRYAWTAYYLTFPLLQPIAELLRPAGKRASLYFSFTISIISLAMIIFLKWPVINNTSLTWNDYCNNANTMCSPASAEFLIKNQYQGNLLSLYGWGGWLIWNYPQIKPTIDGRMHLWIQNGYSGFKEYYSLEQNLTDIDKSKYNIVYMPPDKPVYSEMETLVKKGKWQKIYSDNKAGIFIKNK